MNLYITFFLFVHYFVFSAGAPNKVCQPGDTSKRGKCWDCDCHEGLPRCFRSCPGEDIECTPGENFYIDCNHCTCGKDTIPECGRKLCLSSNKTKEVRQKREEAAEVTTPKTICTPGENITRGRCWDCDCYKGLHRCVPWCHGKDYEDIECETGEKFYIECNHCVCGYDGIPECSRAACQSDSDRFHNITKSRPGGLPKILTDCTPGSVWKSECEDCICLSDGRKSCTKTCD